MPSSAFASSFSSRATSSSAAFSWYTCPKKKIHKKCIFEKFEKWRRREIEREREREKERKREKEREREKREREREGEISQKPCDC